jgi:hypothetical protein
MQKTVHVNKPAWRTRGSFDREINRHIDKMSRRGFACLERNREGSGWVLVFQQGSLVAPLPALMTLTPSGQDAHSIRGPTRLFDATLHDVWAAVPNCIAELGYEVESSDRANGEVVFCSGVAASSSGERYVILVAPVGNQTQVSVSGAQRSRFGKPCEARIAKISNQFLTAINGAVGPRA